MTHSIIRGFGSFVRNTLTLRDSSAFIIVLSALGLNYAWSVWVWLAFALAFLVSTGVWVVSYMWVFISSMRGVLDFGTYSEVTYDPDADRIARRLGVKLKGIRVTYNRNAIAYTNIFSRVVTISKRWLDEWTPEEYYWVLTHEIGHIKRASRYFVEVIAVMGVVVLYVLAQYRLPAAFAQIAAIAVAMLLVQGRSHKNELSSDAVARDLFGPVPGISVLEDFGRRWGFKGGSETHPSTLRRLREISKGSRPEDNLPRY